MQRAQQEPPLEMEMSLREHLLAASAGTNAAPAPYPTAAPPQQQNHENPYQRSEGSPREQHHHLDPNVTGQQMPYGMGGDGMDDGMGPNSAKGKRELSTSKRAAQNRAAQRAFRQRKEGYIKKLEEQVKDLESMSNNYKALQNENYQLREYILNLQSRLLENQAEFPPAPSHINLHAPNAATVDSPYPSAEQQLRREMEGHRQDGEGVGEVHDPNQPHPPPPAPVVAREDPAAVSRGGLEQLQAAAAQGDSPYGEYPRETPGKDGEVRQS